MKNPLKGFNGQLAILGFFRYSLPRHTYIVGCCIDWLIENWRYVDQKSRKIIVKEIQEEKFQEGLDKQCWESFLMWIFEKGDK